MCVKSIASQTLDIFWDTVYFFMLISRLSSYIGQLIVMDDFKISKLDRFRFEFLKKI